MSPFRPNKQSFTLILSSPAHFVGEFISDKFLLTHAWKTFGSDLQEFDLGSRHSRHFFALTFRERERSEEELHRKPPPYHDYVGDYFCIFLSLFFGKRFDNHGFLLDHGFYCLPNIQAPQPLKSHTALPFTSTPRKDLGTSLNFDEAKLLVPILDQIFCEVDDTGELPEDSLLAFTSGRFYQKGLQLYDSDPELAFLSFINAGEVLVSGLTFSNQDMVDDDYKNLLSEINAHLKPETAALLKSKFFRQISRRFRKGLSGLLNDSFYGGSESGLAFARLTADNIDRHLKAAYGLRSQFLHRGTRFARWVSFEHQGAEIPIGTPAYGGEQWKKLLAAVPTLIGLERIIRFALLRFIHQRISRLHVALD